MNDSPATVASPPTKALFEGTWAARVTFPVTWYSMVVRVRAQDAAVVELRGCVRRRRDGDGYSETFTPCGLTLPRYHIGDPARASRFLVPDSLFDERFFPASAPYRVEPASASSFTLGSEPITLLAGLRMPRPASDPWPPRTETLGQEQGVDVDYDGASGFALVPDIRDGLVAPGAWINLRLTQVHAALRLRFSYYAQALGLDEIRGVATPIGNGIDTRAFEVGVVRPDGTGAQRLGGQPAKWIDTNINLKFDPTRATQVIMRRVADNTTPRRVREMAL